MGTMGRASIAEGGAAEALRFKQQPELCWKRGAAQAGKQRGSRALRRLQVGRVNSISLKPSSNQALLALKAQTYS